MDSPTCSASIRVSKPMRAATDRRVRTRRLTRDEYTRAAELGLFRPEEHLELLDGDILVQMSPQKEPHAVAVDDTAQALTAAFGPGFYVRQQKPMVLGDDSEPEPDIVVVPGAPRDYLASHPKPADVRLLVEVADTALRLDRGRKRSAYARVRIPEYWILNLRERRLEIYRDPVGARYRSATTYGLSDIVTPLGAPRAIVHVADLLAPAE